MYDNRIKSIKCIVQNPQFGSQINQNLYFYHFLIRIQQEIEQIVIYLNENYSHINIVINIQFSLPIIRIHKTIAKSSLLQIKRTL